MNKFRLRSLFVESKTYLYSKKKRNLKMTGTIDNEIEICNDNTIETVNIFQISD